MHYIITQLQLYAAAAVWSAKSKWKTDLVRRYRERDAHERIFRPGTHVDSKHIPIESASLQERIWILSAVWHTKRGQRRQGSTANCITKSWGPDILGRTNEYDGTLDQTLIMTQTSLNNVHEYWRIRILIMYQRAVKTYETYVIWFLLKKNQT